MLNGEEERVKWKKRRTRGDVVFLFVSLTFNLINTRSFTLLS